jgi:deoxycytidine triphosphate deaminase
MILSNDGIIRALKEGALEISPSPSEKTQINTSAVDLYLGAEFFVWDKDKLNVPGLKTELRLMGKVSAWTGRVVSRVVSCGKVP